MAQGVAGEVKRQGRDENGKPGKQNQPPRVEDVGLAVGDDVAPRGLRRLHAEAEETQPGLGQDRLGHAQHGGDEDRRGGVRQDVAENDARRALPERPRRLHVGGFAQGEELGPHEPRGAGPAHEPDDDDDVDDAGAEEGDGGEDEEKRGEAHDGVHDAHDHVVRPAAEIPGHRADGHADEKRHEHGDEADRERNVGAVEQAAEHVAAEVVRAEPVHGIRREQLALEVGGVRVGGKRDTEAVEDEENEGDRGEHGDDAERGHADAVGAEAPPGASGRAGGRGFQGLWRRGDHSSRTLGSTTA